VKVSKYKFVFDRSGEIFHCDAPFYNAKNSRIIGDYLPLYAELDSIDYKTITPKDPYEFSIKDTTFYVDLYLEELDRNGKIFYELTVNDHTTHYTKFQKERSQKNKNKIENIELREINKRLNSKLKEVESFLSYAINTDVRFPLTNIKSILEVLLVEKVIDDRTSKIIESSLTEIVELEHNLEGIIELQNLTHCKSFEDSYYCTLIEIIEEAKRNVKIPHDLEFSLSLDEDKLLFVNKYHFSNIIQKLISYFFSYAEKGDTEVKISSTVNDEVKQIDITVKSKELKNLSEKTSVIEMLNGPIGKISQEKKDLPISLAKKIINLYDGQIIAKSSKNDELQISLNFDHLPFKTCELSLA